MSQNPQGKRLVQDYIKACGYGVNPPNSKVRPPILKTGDVVRDYIEACGFGLHRDQKSKPTLNS